MSIELAQASVGAPARRWKPYPAYKDSGEEWVGKVPEHWAVKRLKRIGWLRSGTGFPNEEQGKVNGEIPFYKVSDMNIIGNEVVMIHHNNSISEETALSLGATLFHTNTIIFPKVGAALLTNKRRILTRPSCIDNNTMAFNVRFGNMKYIYYYLLCLDLARLANPGAVPSLNEGQVCEIEAPFPPLPEQRAIASFLDHQTAHLDALISKKERLIVLLEEKRAALISSAVTKGLDPNMPMKDSGVEWLGEVPERWEIKRLRFICEINPSKSEVSRFPSDTLVSFLPMEMIDENGTLSLEETRTIEQVWQGFTYFKDNDVILAKITPCFENGKGAICSNLLNGIGFGTTELHVIRSLELSHSRFIYYLTKSDLFRKIGTAMMYGAAGQQRVPEDFIKDFRVGLPPLPEQRAIASFLDRETTKIDALIAKIHDGIEKLREYITALISAAVTGKIDVREVV